MLDRVFQSLTSFGIDPENPRELGAVYLVGGATAFPAVTRALRDKYKRKVQLAPQPHAAEASRRRWRRTYSGASWWMRSGCTPSRCRAALVAASISGGPAR